MSAVPGMGGTGVRVAAFVAALVLAFGAAFAVGNAVTPFERGTQTHDTDPGADPAATHPSATHPAVVPSSTATATATATATSTATHSHEPTSTSTRHTSDR